MVLQMKKDANFIVHLEKVGVLPERWIEEFEIYHLDQTTFP